RAEHAGRRHRRDGPGGGRDQRRTRRVAAPARRAVPRARHPPHRRRHPDGLWPHRRLLQLRGGRHRARHHHPVVVDQRQRAAPGRDIWEPGEHNGTFRGFNPAFVTATEAIRRYWSDDELERSTITRGLAIESRFNALVARYQEHGLVAKGRGLARGLQFASGEVAGRVAREAFDNGLLVETSGPQDEVVKLLPPLTITP